jgi:cytochrome c-type biogenesis protein CcmH
MALWLIFAVMTAAAMLAVVWPLVRSATAARSGSDVAVYRDQLDEVERDLRAGLIGQSEAEAARVEISRRLLAAADAAQAGPPDSNVASAVRRRRTAAVASLVALPIVAASFYLPLGSPELGAPDGESVQSLIAQAEAHLGRNPEDGRGWEILAPVYMRLDRYSDAVTAWRNALRILGESAERQAYLGEALTAEADGTVTAEAKAAFVRAITLDDTIISARYYLGLAAEQDGDREQAAKIWRQLIAEAPAGAFWISDVRNALARVESDSTAPPGPGAAQMAAAGQPPGQQSAMIRGMVDRLAARLREDGADVDGWLRLVRSYKVLGESEKARVAATQAQQALAGDPGKLQQFNVALKELDAGNAAVAAPTPGPSAAQMASAADQPPDQQAAMIRGMVERLAARLTRDGSDVVGWVQLVRSYKVLGESEKARSAAAQAQQALAGDPGKLQQLDLALKELNAGNASVAAPAPHSGGDGQPAAGVTPDHQQGATMEAMVERLAERLKASGSEPEGWLTLVRSYETLGEKDKAAAAIEDARRALASDRNKLEQFNHALKTSSVGK